MRWRNRLKKGHLPFLVPLDRCDNSIPATDFSALVAVLLSSTLDASDTSLALVRRPAIVPKYTYPHDNIDVFTLFVV